jgi:molybdopterin molybdotransferase
LPCLSPALAGDPGGRRLAALDAGRPPAGRAPIRQDGRVRTVEEHQAVVAALLAPLGEEEVPLAAAHGRVLARDVSASVPLPGFDNSAMDGYAARWADVSAAPVRLPVADDIPAGRTDVVPLAPGTVQRIMTGAILPPGTDVIVPVELTDGGTDVVEIRDSPAAGTHLRHAGEDIAAGTVALTAGSPLGAAQLGLAAAVGVRTLTVRRRPRVLVLSTGSELVEPGEPLLPGQVYESNSLLLCAAVEDAGGSARRLHFVPDDVGQFLATVRAELAGADLLVTSGGVSAGAYEVVKDAFRTLGTVEFGKVAMQPGGPQGAGTVDGVPVVTLPGNPVSSFVSFEVFVRPALRRALGHAAPDRLRAPATLTTPLRSPAGRRQFLRGRYDAGQVSQVGGPGSHLVAHLARANCLVVVPEDVTELPAGAAVDVVLIEGALQ